MITSLKDNEGRIVAYCEWRLVGQSGLETPSGEYIWINDIWIHEYYRNKCYINRVIDEIMILVPQAKYCYFQRRDVNNKLHLWSRSQFERRRNRYDKLIIGDK